jgi:hypothetical protein
VPRTRNDKDDERRGWQGSRGDDQASRVTTPFDDDYYDNRGRIRPVRVERRARVYDASSTKGAGSDEPAMPGAFSRTCDGAIRDLYHKDRGNTFFDDDDDDYYYYPRQRDEKGTPRGLDRYGIYHHAEKTYHYDLRSSSRRSRTARDKG